MVDMIDINNNTPTITEYIIKFFNSNTCCTEDLKDYPRKTSRHKPSIITITENKNNILASYPTEPNAHGDLSNKGSCISE